MPLGCGHDAPTPSAPAAAPSACRHGKVFVLVRHAEKASNTEKDPSLSERGKERAAALASMFASAGVTRLVATPYKRTQETLAPLASRIGRTVEVRPADRTADLVSELRGAPDGAVVVVATHSNVLPDLARQLGTVELSGVVDGALPEDDFSRVVAITQGCGATRPVVLELRSGD